MAVVGYIQPRFRQGAFTCPHCNCFSQHLWRFIKVDSSFESDTEATTSWCLKCHQYCFWNRQDLVWPIKSGLPDPIDGSPEQVKDVYNEARNLFPHSPRAAAALLRLAIQIVCVERGLPGKNLNEDIGALVANGLAVEIQQSLDLVRVVGNNAVHPGQIVIEENKENISKFFTLVNLIVDVLIVQPAKINAMFNTLVSPAQQKQIATRDGKP
jgi:hypothetical protein